MPLVSLSTDSAKGWEFPDLYSGSSYRALKKSELTWGYILARFLSTGFFLLMVSLRVSSFWP